MTNINRLWMIFPVIRMFCCYVILENVNKHLRDSNLEAKTSIYFALAIKFALIILRLVIEAKAVFHDF
jgi:hypothetical protein